jgi:hypothetical protein
MKPIEKLILCLTAPAGESVYLTIIGFGLIPAMLRLRRNSYTGWSLALFLLGVLILLRVVPAIVRKIVPFSGAILTVWMERRQLAKRYDSYQWRKLFWIGLGLALYIMFSHRFAMPQVVISSFCVAAGALGLLRWNFVMSRENSVSALPQMRGPA